MMQQTHAIKKQTVTVLAVAHDGLALKRKIERVLTDEVSPRLNRLFDRLAPGNRWVQIERLDVALDNLHETETDEEMADKIVDAIERQMVHIAPVPAFEPEGAAEAEPFTVRTAEERMLDALVHFLRRGTLPWWFTPMPHEAFEDALNRFLASPGAQAYRTNLQALLGTDVAMRRLATQFSDTVFWNLLALVYPHTQSEAGQARGYLQRLREHIDRRGAGPAIGLWPAEFKKRMLAATQNRQAWAHWAEWTRPLPTAVTQEADPEWQRILTPNHRGGNQTEAVETRPPANPGSAGEQAAEAFLHFLQHGTFPPAYRAPDHTAWETLLSNHLGGQPQAARYRSRLQQVLATEKAAIRLAVQFSDEVFWGVLKLLHPPTEKAAYTPAQTLLAAITDTTQKHAAHPVHRHLPAILKKTALQQAGYRDAAELYESWQTRIREELRAIDDKPWLKALRKHKLLKKYLAPDTGGQPADPEDEKTMDAVCQYLQRGTTPLSTIELEGRLLRVLRSGQTIRYRNRLQKVLRHPEAQTRLIHGFADETFWHLVTILYPETDTPEIRRAQSRYTNLLQLTDKRPAQKNAGLLPVALKQSWLLEKSPADIRLEWDTRLRESGLEPDHMATEPQTDIAWPAPAENAAPTPAEKSRPIPYFTEPATEEGQLVANAGLVILGPFLPEFFKRCGVCTDETLTHPDKALALLHYLAFGQTEYREYDILLNKVLCGLDPAEPIDALVVLGDDDRQQAEELLTAVVSYWEALKGTSPDGLREGFLQRTGKLTHSPEGWFLRPEQQTLDILLQYIPWTIGLTKLPWMPQMLKTEWN